MDRCWLWYDWISWLLDYFIRSGKLFDISQILQNRILTSIWVSKNSSSSIIIMGASHFFDFRLLYLLSNTILLYNLMTWFGRCFNSATSPLHEVRTNLTCMHKPKKCIYILCTPYSPHLIFRISFETSGISNLATAWS